MATAAPARTLTAIDAEALRTRSRADFVFESLRDAIADGRIAVGERVREEEIARELGVSRTPVREALQRLQQRGLLVFGTGRGLVVAELSQHQVLQLYAMREILEGSAARFAAQHATAADVAILYRLQKELAEAKPDALLLVTLNRRFHQAIYEAAHNQYLMQTLNMLHELVRAAAQCDIPGAEPPLRSPTRSIGGSSRRSRNTIPTRPRKRRASTSARRSARASRAARRRYSAAFGAAPLPGW